MKETTPAAMPPCSLEMV